ncbi:hypothetical protein [Sciscionella sediminilitoris]|uniref:hypothetical protein n=1 Tax=Sciscionella sediminilitoris TaxID=1445613 RepID=UPI0004DF5C80|nr:hypothetical protein [Sciscionella sp. SE31]
MGNRAIVRALLGALLALGLVGMHAVTAVAAPEPSHHAMVQHEGPVLTAPAEHGGEHGASHSFQHLCLMVLTFLGLVLLFVLSGTVRPGTLSPARGSPHRTAAPDRPPRPAGRSLLNLVCISRT